MCTTSHENITLLFAQYEVKRKMALICYVVLAILIFGCRVAIQLKRTGDHGLRVSTQLSSPIQKLATYLQMLALLAVLAIVILDCLSILKPHFEFAVIGTSVGLTLCAMGAAVTMVSQYQMGKSWRIGVDESEKTELVTHGMFSVSRNPIYFGMLMVGFGFIALVPHIFMVICFVLAYVGIDLQVRKIEEPHLKRVFGDAYQDYTKRISRYIPWVPRS